MFVRFRHILIEDPLGPFRAEELAQVEQELGAALPVAFTEFLAVAQGGTSEYVLDAEGEEISLGSIFRVGTNERGEYGYGTLLGELREHRREKRLPQQVLPFSQGGGDVWFYLDLTPEGSGRVVVFLQGLPEWTGRSQDSRFVQVAPSFNAFLDSLRVDESYAIDNLRNALAQGRQDWITANVEYLEFCLPQWRQEYPDLSTHTDRAMLV